MSGQGQGSQGGQGGQGGQGQGGQGQGGQGQGQDYVVKVDFTDEQGRKWSAGSKFMGDENAVRKAIAAGQVEQKPQPKPQE